MVSVGTIIWLSSELMFFAGLFAMYFTARSHAGGSWPPPPTELNLPLAVPVTLVLIASSFTCQMGVFAAERGDLGRRGRPRHDLVHGPGGLARLKLIAACQMAQDLRP